MEPLALDTFGTVSLAGGGNRCWWQAGVLEVFLDSGRWQAQRVSGTSAGAGVAAAALCGALAVAVAHCQRAYT
jgi:predicted acylesterase/phospholipase RssA